MLFCDLLFFHWIKCCKYLLSISKLQLCGSWPQRSRRSLLSHIHSLFNPLPWNVGWTSALIPINRIWQEGWDVSSQTGFQNVSGCCLAHLLLASGLLSVTKPTARLWAALQKIREWNGGRGLKETSNQQARGTKSYQQPLDWVWNWMLSKWKPREDSNTLTSACERPRVRGHRSALPIDP